MLGPHTQLLKTIILSELAKLDPETKRSTMQAIAQLPRHADDTLQLRCDRLLELLARLVPETHARIERLR